MGIKNWEVQLQMAFEDLKLDEVPGRDMFSGWLLGQRHSPDWGEDRDLHRREKPGGKPGRCGILGAK